MYRETMYPAPQRSRPSVSRIEPPPSRTQHGHQQATSGIFQTSTPDENYQPVQNEPNFAQGHSYPSINAFDNSNLILGNVHEVHYHVSAPTTHIREQLLSSLHFREMSMRYDNIDDPHGDTFNWILSTPNPDESAGCSIRDWIAGDHSMFWVSGKPGSGKSVLMKHLAQNIQQLARSDDASSSVLSFWFWEAAHQELERSLLGCLRSLLWQVLEGPAQGGSVIEAIKRNLMFEWTKRRLHDALKTALRDVLRSGSRIFIFLDGLDECGGGADESLTFIRDISQSLPKLKICVSSRPELIFQHSLAHYPHLIMQKVNEQDIRKIVQQELFEAPDFSSSLRSEADAHLFENELVNGAQGVLLWVRIVIKDLLLGVASGDTLPELILRLHRLPTELDGDSGLYAFMLKRNTKNSKHYITEAALYLQLACRNDLSLLSYALATNDALRNAYLEFQDGWQTFHHQVDCDRLARAIPARTGGLLEVHDNSYCFDTLRKRAAKTRDGTLTSLLDNRNRRYLRFIHRTARSYLLETKTGQDILALQARTASDIDRILFETKTVCKIQLHCLESVAPLDILSAGLLRVGQPTGNGVRLFKKVVGTLAQKGYFWMESYLTRWQGSNYEERLPLPLLTIHGGQISFVHLFAFQSWEFLEEELQLTNLTNDPQYLVSILCSALMGLRHSLRLRRFRSLEHMISHRIDPNVESINDFGERISAYRHLQCEWSSWAVSIRANAPSMEAWLQQASYETRSRNIEPTLTQSSSLFFQNPWRGSPRAPAYLLGTFSPDEYDYLTQSTREAAFITSKSSAIWIICHWPIGKWIPDMYAISSGDFEHADVANLKFINMFRVGIVEPQESLAEFSKWSETKELQLPRVKSLIEAFRLLGKTEAAIDAFIALEKPRIQRTYDEYIYQAWLSWLYGPEEISSDLFLNTPRPRFPCFSVKWGSYD